MHPWLEQQLSLTRRQFFGRSGVGLGTAALATLLGNDKAAAKPLPIGGASPSPSGVPHGSGLPGLPHFAPKARRVIYLMQGGAPTHVDLFDYKPGLAARRGQLLPPSVQMGQRLTTMTQNQRQLILPGIAPFRQHGR